MSVSLKQMFESHKDDLSTKLKGLCLPNDEDKIIRIVNDYLNSVFDADGDFRQSLTQSEDYILQAAMTLLQAQRGLAETIKASQQVTSRPLDCAESNNNGPDSESPSLFEKYVTVGSAVSLIGAGVGAVAGKLVFGGWGAVLGALAGTAIAIYSASYKAGNKPLKVVDAKVENPVSVPLDTDAFINTISSICSSVDSLLDTFRAQINSVVVKYESQSKPSLDTHYLPLLESIQTLVGYERTHSEDEEKFVKKLKDRIEDVSEVLDNWNLQMVDYDGENSVFFDKIPSDKAIEERMVYPAIVKNSSIVLKGKVFTPKDRSYENR